MYALPHDVVLTLDITANVFNDLSPDIREFLITEGVQVPLKIPMETNYQGKQMLLFVRNSAAE